MSEYDLDRDPMALDEAGNYYAKHVLAMTAESLHSKMHIAQELGHRDMVIDRLRGQLQNAANHLDRAKRRSYKGNYDAAVESANKALYETLNS
jgi:hypothetical protein